MPKQTKKPFNDVIKNTKKTKPKSELNTTVISRKSESLVEWTKRLMKP